APSPCRLIENHSEHNGICKIPQARREDNRVEPPGFYLLLLSGGRELLEHFLHSLVQILDVFVRVVGESVARGSPPKKFLCLCVEQVYDQCAYFIGFGRGRGLAHSPAAKPPPPPASAEPVVKGIQGFLVA